MILISGKLNNLGYVSYGSGGSANSGTTGTEASQPNADGGYSTREGTVQMAPTDLLTTYYPVGTKISMAEFDTEYPNYIDATTIVSDSSTVQDLIDASSSSGSATLALTNGVLDLTSVDGGSYDLVAQNTTTNEVMHADKLFTANAPVNKVDTTKHDYSSVYGTTADSYTISQAPSTGAYPDTGTNETGYFNHSDAPPAPGFCWSNTGSRQLNLTDAINPSDYTTNWTGTDHMSLYMYDNTTDAGIDQSFLGTQTVGDLINLMNTYAPGIVVAGLYDANGNSASSGVFRIASTDCRIVTLAGGGGEDKGWLFLDGKPFDPGPPPVLS